MLKRNRNKMKIRFTVFIFLVFFSLKGIAQTESKNRANNKFKVDSTALWQPGMSIMQHIREVCAKAKFPDFGKCFVTQMKVSGASPQAVEFAKMTDNQGYLRDFKRFGLVDVAYSNFPFRANENQVCFLVNGSPNMIDVDDYNLMPLKGIKKNIVYKVIASKYPDVTIWPGDRSGTNYPVMLNLPGGGERFIFSYQLQKGCHACAILGNAKFAFDFNRSGKFLGVKVISVETISQAK